MDRVDTTWAGIIKHLLDMTSPNIIFIWSGEVILGLGFASPNITLPDQINMILVSVLSNKCILVSLIYTDVNRKDENSIKVPKANKMEQLETHWPELLKSVLNYRKNNLVDSRQLFFQHTLFSKLQYQDSA